MDDNAGGLTLSERPRELRSGGDICLIDRGERRQGGEPKTPIKGLVRGEVGRERLRMLHLSFRKNLHRF